VNVRKRMLYVWVDARRRCREVDALAWEPVYDAMNLQPLAATVRGRVWMEMNA